MATLGHIEFTVDVNTDKLKIAQLESQLELIGHAAQQVIGTAHGSFWLGRDRLSVSAYTIDQLRKLVGYEWNEPAGRFGMDDASRELATVQAELDACKEAYATIQKAVDAHAKAYGELNAACTQAISERDQLQTELAIARKRAEVAEGKANELQKSCKDWHAAWDRSQDELHDWRRRVDDLNDERVQLRAEVKNLQDANDALSRAAGGPDAGELRKEVERLREELAGVNKALDTTKTLERGLREENQRRAAAIQGHQAKIKELNEENAQLTSGLDKALDENEFLKAKLGKLRYETKIRADQLLAFVAHAKA